MRDELAHWWELFKLAPPPLKLVACAAVVLLLHVLLVALSVVS